MPSLRERIAAAARELVLSDGVEGLSMRKLAGRVGVSAPAIYRHFGDKEALLDEIVAEGLRILEGYLRPALGAATPYERLLQMTDGYLNFALEQPTYFDFAFMTASRDIDGLAHELAKPELETFRMAIEQVAACQRDGVFAPDDPIEVGIALWAGVHGLVTLYRTGRFGSDERRFRELYRRSVDRVLRGLAARQG